MPGNLQYTPCLAAFAIMADVHAEIAGDPSGNGLLPEKWDLLLAVSDQAAL